MATDLLQETVQLLKASSESERQIANATATSQKWINLLKNEQATNPSYVRLVRVRDYLKSRARSAGLQ